MCLIFCPVFVDHYRIYYQACRHFNKPYYDFGQAKYITKSGDDVFQSVCRNLLESIDDEASLYDLILIDEAQDFKPEFLQLCYKLLDENKRLIYAYDELQNLTDDPMPSPEEIWGAGPTGEPLVHFGSPSQDIILDVCYRNPGPILVSAHALGFGIYRKPMIQMFDYAELWNEIGYETRHGRLKDGEVVELARTSKSSPALLSGHNSAGELIQVLEFDSRLEEYRWVAEQIKHNIKNEEILPSDIIVIHPNTKVMRNEIGILRELLFADSINSSIAGVTSSPDQFSFEDQVTFTSIYRAKGNEAAMVYIINADYCNIDFELAKKRNILFTAMTRTKAWLRISGVGAYFKGLKSEFDRVVEHNFTLEFTYPSEDERRTMRVVNRDMTQQERIRVKQARKNAENLASLLGGDVNIEDIPEELRKLLIQKLTGGQK